MQTKANDFRLADEECWSEQRFLCLLDVSSCSSGSGNLTEDGQCVFIGETPQTWHASRAYCLRQGGDLLSLMSKTLQEDITRLMRRTNDTMTKRHWIGATSVTWTWVTGEPMLYANWTRDTPSGRPNTCTTMSSPLHFGWTNEHCNATKPFVCQFEIQTSTTAESATAASDVTPREAEVESSSVDASTGPTLHGEATSTTATTSDGSGKDGQTEQTVVESNGLSRFNIILIIVGVAVVVCLAIIVVVCVSYKKRERTAVQVATSHS